MTQHVLILSELITALGMESEIEPILARWYENNNAIVEIMILVNPKLIAQPYEKPSIYNFSLNWIYCNK